MSTLWTPGGEVPVDDRRSASAAGASASADASAGAGAATSSDSLREAMEAAGVSLGEVDIDSLTPEERAQAEAYIRKIAESREQLRATPAAVVISNHAMGIYELAALHLSSQPPNFTEATLAIDALGVLIDGMKGRLGEAEPGLHEARSQLQIAFVQLKNRADSAPATDNKPSVTNDPSEEPDPDTEPAAGADEL